MLATMPVLIKGFKRRPLTSRLLKLHLHSNGFYYLVSALINISTHVKDSPHLFLGPVASLQGTAVAYWQSIKDCSSFKVKDPASLDTRVTLPV